MVPVAATVADIGQIIHRSKIVFFLVSSTVLVSGENARRVGLQLEPG